MVAVRGRGFSCLTPQVVLEYLEEDNPRGTPGLPQHTDHAQDISAPIPHQRNLECKSNLCTASPFGGLVSAKGRYWAGNDGEDNVQQMACVVPLL